jgi:hypothetical protein
MTQHASSQRALAAVVVVVAAAFAALSCRDPDLPTAALPAVAVDPVDFATPDFDVFDADVVIRQEGSAPAAGAPLSKPPRTITYHVQRTLQPSGIWASTKTFSGQRWGGFGADVARIESDETRSYFRRYDRAGALIAPPPGAPKPPAAAPAIQSRFAGRGTPSRDWIGNLIVTPQSGARVRAALDARFGKPQERVEGRDRYVSTRGTTVVELLVDPATGAIVEEIVASNGKRVVRTVHEYDTAASGVLMKRSSRAEIARPDGSSSVIVTELQNVRIGKQRGAK